MRMLKKRKVSTDSENEDCNTNGSRLHSQKPESGTTAARTDPSHRTSTSVFGHDFLTFDPGLALPHHPPIRPSKPDYKVAAYASADEYDLEELLKGFQKLGLYERSNHHIAKANAALGLSQGHDLEEDSKFKEAEQQVRGFNFSSTSSHDELDCIPDITEVLHVIGQYKISSEPREIFFFRDGSLVFWNIDELERSNILTYVKQFCLGDVVSPETMDEQSESLPYSYAEDKTRLSGGRILLTEGKPSYLERYAFSNALAHSVKLGVWETELDCYIDSIKPVAEELRKKGTIILPKKEVFLRLGQLYELRHSLTLSSDLLDTPDYYWDREHLELLYRRTSNYLSISRRTEIMSDKLNNCMQLLELLKNYHGEEQSHRLERIIIYLIIIEVVFESLHFIIK
ncbi:protein of unknown function DUF155 [Trinorchestia longiramus]|nr:protein of unknown function DUF155 [Trinorchestia longiramus]